MTWLMRAPTFPLRSSREPRRSQCPDPPEPLRGSPWASQYPAPRHGAPVLVQYTPELHRVRMSAEGSWSSCVHVRCVQVCVWVCVSSACIGACACVHVCVWVWVGVHVCAQGCTHRCIGGHGHLCLWVCACLWVYLCPVGQGALGPNSLLLFTPTRVLLRRLFLGQKANSSPEAGGSPVSPGPAYPGGTVVTVPRVTGVSVLTKSLIYFKIRRK